MLRLRGGGDAVAYAAAAGGAAAVAPPAIQVRANFNPLPLCVPALRTDADGKASVSFALSDSLTQYAVFASAAAFVRESDENARVSISNEPAEAKQAGGGVVGVSIPKRAAQAAAAGRRAPLAPLLPARRAGGGAPEAEEGEGGGVLSFFGEQRRGTASVQVSLPLQVRGSLPRFLSLGDAPQLPVVVRNATEHARDVEVVIRASACLVLHGGGQNNAIGRRVTLQPQERRLFVFPATARVPEGSIATRGLEAKVQIAARSAAAAGGGDAAALPELVDAQQLTVPILLPQTRSSFAVYGQMEGEEMAGKVFVQPVARPEGASVDMGGLEVLTSATQLQGLSGALLELTGYEFECAEQLSSRVLGICALKPVLSVFRADGLPSVAEMSAAGPPSSPRASASLACVLPPLCRLPLSSSPLPRLMHSSPARPPACLHLLPAFQLSATCASSVTCRSPARRTLCTAAAGLLGRCETR